ncbi:hypothetical protein HPB47_012327 [Ixodes persulcatus]|uniref:Uncharacterized protein n=1 Tax=Ixodes persulcatus TaxID=34615 RepID=A0AC60NTU4_IXOPE|nr:hypothetical protein HPB47_012327 [Ixodes persulcatus]
MAVPRFPLNDPELLKAWMEKLPCRDWKISRWSKLCSLHFADNCLYQLNNKTYLRQGSVPTVFSSPASKTKRSPRKRSRSQSDEAFLLCQRPKHRHRVLSTSRHKLQKARKLLKQAKKKINRKTARIRKLNTLLLNRNWKIPLGYALIDGLDGNARANLVREYIIKLKDAGAKCISVTCDGTNCNITMLTALGVRFAQQMKSWFAHPSDPNSRVHAVLDACHMLKLMRNLLAEKGCIRDGAGRVVAWRYLAALDNLQQQEGLHAANKLRKQHIDFERQKMKVSLAAQTLSRNQVTILERIEQASRYLRALKDVTGKPLSQGARKTPVLGFLLVLDSITGLAEDLVWSPSPALRCLLTRKLSQDHLELFFATVRNRTGNNNNPTALEFRSAYRKCLLANVLPSTCGNCQVDGTKTLLVSSSAQHQQDQRRAEDARGEEASSIVSYKPLSEFAECVVEYIAGNVAVNFAKITKCPECSKIALLTRAKCDLILIKDAGGLHSPSQDILGLCKIGEKVLRRHFDKAAKEGRNWLQKLQTEAMAIIFMTPLFKRFDHLFLAQTIDSHSHCAIMVKTMLEYFFKLRIHHMCRQQSAAERGRTVRQFLTKLVIFRGY